MNDRFEDWNALAASERGGGDPFTPGIVGSRVHDCTPARRGMARAVATFVANRKLVMSFEPGSSYADVRHGRVNLDGALVSPAESNRKRALPIGLPDLETLDDEVLLGVAVHEGAHHLCTPAHHERDETQRFFINLLEDERIERWIAGEKPVFAGPLATARGQLITAGGLGRTAFEALYLLIRAPHLLPKGLRKQHAALLETVIDLLTPFPDSHAAVVDAAARISKLLPAEVRRRTPEFPEFGATARDPDQRRPRRGRFRRIGRDHDALSAPDPTVMWLTAPPAPDGYATYKAATTGLTKAIRAGLVPPEETAFVASAHGKTDRRRLSRHRHDDRIFKRGIPVRGRLDIVLILDLSGSMRGSRWESQHRLAVAFAEAVSGSRGLRLTVYGHGADAESRPSTQIYRLAAPGKTGRNATCLGDLPEGANNRDGHALRLIGRDLLDHHPTRERRIVLHACDGSPSAAGYGGQPALGSTRDALRWFRSRVAPIGQIGLEVEQDLAPFGAPFIDWDESRAAILLRRLLQQLS